MKYSLQYYQELDGVRGASALGVIIAHVNLAWFPNAFAAMELFFVISGFLITSILLKKYQEEEKVDLLDFWKRRFLRLYPVLVVVVAVFCLVAYLTVDDYEAPLIDGVLTLFYVSNFTKLEPMHFPTLFGQSWSLSIEEQFYFIWPIIFWVGLKLRKNPQQIASFLLALTVAVFIWKQYLINTGAVWERLYYSTDARSDAFVVGGLLAIYYPSLARWSSVGWSKAALLLLVACYGLVFVFGTTRVVEYFVWQQVVVVLGSCALILIVIEKEDSFLKRFFANKILVYLGQRSYGLYLWHWPIIWFANVHFALDKVLLLIIAFVSTILLAHISYKYIELPFMVRRKAMIKSVSSQNSLQSASA